MNLKDFKILDGVLVWNRPDKDYHEQKAGGQYNYVTTAGRTYTYASVMSAVWANDERELVDYVRPTPKEKALLKAKKAALANVSEVLTDKLTEEEALAVQCVLNLVERHYE
jgi:hypothetical protein